MSNKNVIDIEINTSYYAGKNIKNLAYICGLYSKSTKRGEEYDENFTTVQINLDCYEKNKNKALEEYLLQEVTSHKVYTNSLSIFNLNIVKCNDIYYNCDNKEDIPDYIRWGALIYTRDFNKIPDISKNILTEEEVEKIMDKLEKLNDDSLFMSELEAMEWQQWEDKSIQTEIRKEGYVAGRERGITLGRAQETKEIILSMVNNNLPMETISKVTNKTIEEIKEIIK